MIPLLTRKLHDVGSCLVTPDITHYTRGAGMSLTELPVIPPLLFIQNYFWATRITRATCLYSAVVTSIQNSSSSLFSGTSVGIISHVKYVLCMYICTIYLLCGFIHRAVAVSTSTLHYLLLYLLFYSNPYIVIQFLSQRRETGLLSFFFIMMNDNDVNLEAPVEIQLNLDTGELFIIKQDNRFIERTLLGAKIELLEWELKFGMGPLLGNEQILIIWIISKFW